MRGPGTLGLCFVICQCSIPELGVRWGSETRGDVCVLHPLSLPHTLYPEQLNHAQDRETAVSTKATDNVS